MTTSTIFEPNTLEQVLTYRHPGVVRRYAKDHRVTMAEANELFREMLKFLYLNYRGAINTPEEINCAVSTEIGKIDWMWHTFLLFTKDYAAFCDEYFGFFLHHVPTEDDETTFTDNEHALRAAVERQFSFIYDVLGAETLCAWYDERRYAAKVTRPALGRLVNSWDDQRVDN